jgi:DNA-binding beta-propeller fold protein YncE
MTEMCLNPTNSKIYVHVPFNNRIYVLDKDGKIIESMAIAKLDPKANVNDSNIKIHIEDIPFPLNNNSRYGFEINSKLNKIYLTIEGKSQDFLSIIDLNY